MGHPGKSAEHSSGFAEHSSGPAEHSGGFAEHSSRSAEHSSKSAEHSSGPAEHSSGFAEHSSRSAEHPSKSAEHSSRPAEHSREFDDQYPRNCWLIPAVMFASSRSLHVNAPLWARTTAWTLEESQANAELALGGYARTRRAPLRPNILQDTHPRLPVGYPKNIPELAYRSPRCTEDQPPARVPVLSLVCVALGNTDMSTARLPMVVR